MRALGRGRHEEMSADEALAIAAKASPETVAENDPYDPNGRKVRDKVRVLPDDYGERMVERSFALGPTHRNTPSRRTGA